MPQTVARLDLSKTRSVTCMHNSGRWIVKLQVRIRVIPRPVGREA